MATLAVYSLDDVPFWFERSPSLTVSDLARHVCPDTAMGIFEQHSSTGVFHLLDGPIFVSYLLQDWEDFGLHNARLVVPIFAQHIQDTANNNTLTTESGHLRLPDIRTERLELGDDILETLSKIKQLTLQEPQSPEPEILPPQQICQGTIIFLFRCTK